MLAFVFLVAAAMPCDSDKQNQTELTQCWSNRAQAADAQLKAAYQKADAELRALGVDPTAFAASQKAFESAAGATCDFQYGLYRGGSIAPMVDAQCDDRLARERIARIASTVAALKNGASPATQPASAKASAALASFYAQLSKQDLTKEDRATLVDSQHKWTVYRDKACALEGGSCLSELDLERVEDLKAGWVGEQFW